MNQTIGNQTPPPSFTNHEDAYCSLYTCTVNHTHVALTPSSSSPITFRIVKENSQKLPMRI
ncbi:hypothetical protein H5410_033263 [Solanum commersonii]|uniref:Uncharacterized protein n=1 Tax=Solanum commersonii TaxID=4109 RepID=A0A9J5YPN3_SOLCO|nr:hypothetical protein H5410_033263 [Solanum commersonii]